MSNIVCAYCHIKGHHIKFCAELAEKNRRRQEYAARHSYQVQPKIVVKLAEPSKLHQNRNIFADLYSSEEEEGEIVEDERSNSVKMRRLSEESNDSLSESETETDSDIKWCRSGIKGVVIPIQTVMKTMLDDTDSEDDSDSYEMRQAARDALAEMRMFASQFDGMSWADIECLSDY